MLVPRWARLESTRHGVTLMQREDGLRVAISYDEGDAKTGIVHLAFAWPDRQPAEDEAPELVQSLGLPAGWKILEQSPDPDRAYRHVWVQLASDRRTSTVREPHVKATTSE